MKRMAILGTVAAMTAGSGALAQNSSYAHFGAISDTIRINGNTVFNEGDYTYEARIRVLAGSALGHIVSEQRDSYEDKTIGLAANGSYFMTGCSPDYATGTFSGTIAGFAADEWLHLAYVHRGSNVYIYVNGSLIETQVLIGCYGDRPDSWMSIGMFRYGAGYIPTPARPSFLGDLDWIRISAGARYTANFTPPYECDVSSDASTQLLLKFNEPAGTATLVDESPNHFVCDVGVPVYPGVTATSPTLGNTTDGYPACAPNENSSYAHFGATSDTIRIQGNTVFPTDDATYEAMIRLDPNAPSGQFGYIVSEEQIAVEDKTLLVSSDRIMQNLIRGYNCGASNTHQLTAPLNGTWHHIASVRQGASAYLYIDGVRVETWTSQPSCTTDAALSLMAIGMMRYGSVGNPASGAIPSFLGDLDWIRISAGARYTANFTPPYECDVSSDASTQLLLKFNEPAGTATLVDESPNHFVCDVGVPVAKGVTATSPTLGNTAGGFPACAPVCDSDIDQNHATDGIDLAIVLARWGTNPTDYPRADCNHDGIVNGPDLAIVLGGWGTCP